MGVRLNGPSLKPAAVLDMPSQAIVRGSIQIAGDGVPTVLLADHQTTGGYPKIATILSGDVDQFVQLRSRHWVTFDLVSSEKAIAIARGQNQVRKRYLQSLSERNCR
jgi:allophanate hydrolase